METYDIMYKDFKIGEMEFDNKGITATLFDDDFHSALFPIGMNKVGTLIVTEWFEERVFPPERQDKEVLLETLGLKEYNLLKIIKITRASCLKDPTWIKFEPDMKFEDTIWYNFYIKKIII